MMRKADVILILLLFLCILAGFALSDDRSMDSLTSWNSFSNRSNKDEIIAIVKKDNVVIKTIDLSNLKDKEFIKIPRQFAATIAIEHNKICFSDSTCPDKNCVKTGWLSKSGDFAVCLPNKTIIKIYKREKR